MANKLYDEDKIKAVADAIRAKGVGGQMTVAQMPDKIASIETGVTPSGNKALTATTATQTGIDVAEYATVSVAPTPSETKSVTSNGDVTPTSGKLLSKVTVNVPTGVARSSSDLTASGATVTVPAGLYSTQATKSVASGSTGTPSASKGAVSNHAITVTPSVTNTTGYITGGTKTGTGVSVEASELVSGTLSITENGTGVDVTNYKTVDVSVPTSSGKVGQASDGMSRIASTSYAATNATLTVEKTGKYTVRWFGYRSSTSGTNGSQLYIGNTAYGSAQTTFNSTYTNVQTVKLTGVSLTAGQTITVRARSRSTSYYMFVMGLSIVEE